MLRNFFDPLNAWYLAAIKTGGYPLVALLMAIVSKAPCCLLPSELVIPPCRASGSDTGQIPLALWGIVLAGTLGSWIGATAMYWTALLAGRPLVKRYGKYLFSFSPQKIEGARNALGAVHFGGMGVFISRLLPVMRHLIGIPAGIVRMDYWRVSAFTLLGSAIWCSVLCWLGVTMGQDEQLMKLEFHRVSFLAGRHRSGAWLPLLFFVHRHMSKAQDAGATDVK